MATEVQDETSTEPLCVESTIVVNDTVCTIDLKRLILYRLWVSNKWLLMLLVLGEMLLLVLILA